MTGEMGPSDLPDTSPIPLLDLVALLGWYRLWEAGGVGGLSSIQPVSIPAAADPACSQRDQGCMPPHTKYSNPAEVPSSCPQSTCVSVLVAHSSLLARMATITLILRFRLFPQSAPLSLFCSLFFPPISQLISASFPLCSLSFSDVVKYAPIDTRTRRHHHRAALLVSFTCLASVLVYLDFLDHFPNPDVLLSRRPLLAPTPSTLELSVKLVPSASAYINTEPS
ncbi:hypothetical protein B0I35DRAFT_82458 [Stachybotrys elegans]|uniref:Uncharacterized protein n=1 Tax=Stachybotrys elegans TaxID=80388 RepID=A0A8K0SJ22_9HYPO|nr:hypothetical protein B0I35DRAFT_82458 [Stachybotrys elegans]